MYNTMPPMKRVGFELHAKLPAFKRKVEYSQELISKALEKMDNPYIAFSSG